jgi:hypothetical protein
MGGSSTIPQDHSVDLDRARGNGAGSDSSVATITRAA